MNPNHKLIIIDDDPKIIEDYSNRLSKRFQIKTCLEIEDAYNLIFDQEYDVAIIDMGFPGQPEGGLRLIEFIHDKNIPIEIIVLTKNGSVENLKAVRKYGKIKYIEKGPGAMAEVTASVLEALNPTKELTLFLPEKKRKDLAELQKLQNKNENEIIIDGIDCLKARHPKGISKIFLGHGHNQVWVQIEKYIKELGYNVESFETQKYNSPRIFDKLIKLLNECNVAVMVMSGDDSNSNGTIHARQNVVHEIGLFQGRYGLERVIMFRQSNVEVFSNIGGFLTISYENEPNKENFEELKNILDSLS